MVDSLVSRPLQGSSSSSQRLQVVLFRNSRNRNNRVVAWQGSSSRQEWQDRPVLVGHRNICTRASNRELVFTEPLLLRPGPTLALLLAPTQPQEVLLLIVRRMQQQEAFPQACPGQPCRTTQLSFMDSSTIRWLVSPMVLGGMATVMEPNLVAWLKVSLVTNRLPWASLVVMASPMMTSQSHHNRATMADSMEVTILGALTRAVGVGAIRRAATVEAVVVVVVTVVGTPTITTTTAATTPAMGVEGLEVEEAAVTRATKTNIIPRHTSMVVMVVMADSLRTTWDTVLQLTISINGGLDMVFLARVLGWTPMGCSRAVALEQVINQALAGTLLEVFQAKMTMWASSPSTEKARTKAEIEETTVVGLVVAIPTCSSSNSSSKGAVVALRHSRVAPAGHRASSSSHLASKAVLGMQHQQILGLEVVLAGPTRVGAVPAGSRAE